eukprot:NODE_7280_length_450_cov_62.559494.p2 GENE.NODE_7280_length_450_cov_62.559494~~NODE_7280_length_450_cov_62.559494.p2  ORF type:complete len:73 (-),score=1.17 NODE_7280_length_450_cov_62.559494:147-365(-)
MRGAARLAVLRLGSPHHLVMCGPSTIKSVRARPSSAPLEVESWPPSRAPPKADLWCGTRAARPEGGRGTPRK